ncbi:MAG: hypothetical protein J7M25_17445 [Deltaproteobacteria bacterium]|nr:hypothetical protein [Deltaproteobacteria bacterium]
MRKKTSLLALLTVLAFISFSTSTALAQHPKLDRSFEVQNYEPAVGPNQYFTLESTEMPGHLGFGVGLDFTYQDDPLAIYEVQGSKLKTENVVVDYQATFFLTGFFGLQTKGLFGNYLFKQIQFGLALPLTLQSGQIDVSSYPLPSTSPSEVRGFALGDLRFQVKTSLWRFWAERIRLALSATITLPWVGDIPNYQAQNNFAGEKNVTIRPRLSAEFVYANLRAVANVGFLARVQSSQFFSTKVGQQFLYGVGGEYKFWKKNGIGLSALAELVGRNGLSTDLDANPLEADAGIRVGFSWGLSVTAGAGAGIIKAVGSPLWRAFLAVRWAPNWKDTDGDGIPDYKDRCPGQAEDKDGFQDSDGCPDLDNDNDGIPDVRDKCSNAAEDVDRYQDQDGCPDLDNDKDGVPDKVDNCPMNPGPAKTKGCPPDMLDRDGDSVPDSRDKCPDQAEDKDGFQDSDGCPDPDNDNDGVCDPNDSIQENLAKFAKTCKGKDKCPMDPEDRDGFQDADGCPDPDNDGDGFCDNNPVIQKHLNRYTSQCVGKDLCPNKPETINGNNDIDGCPDQGQPDVVIGQRQIQLRRPIRFKHMSPHFAPDVTTILDQIVLHLRWKLTTFKKLVVVAYVEPQMRPSKAKRVSQRWADAIKTYLTRLGIPANQVMAKGLGGARPIFTGHSRSTSRKVNRRVEFYIIR